MVMTLKQIQYATVTIVGMNDIPTPGFIPNMQSIIGAVRMEEEDREEEEVERRRRLGTVTS